MATDFGLTLASVAIGEHQAFSGIHESDARLRKRVVDTYLEELKVADPDDNLGWDQSNDITSWAWSATFTSWCVLAAGAALEEFDFSIRHAVFIQRAIQNEDAGEGVFRARKIDTYAPDIGDLICNNRSGGKITYDQARDSDNYSSHSAIVVEFVEHGSKRYAVTIGGNESDSIRRTEVELTKAGFIKQRSSDPYICVIENSKTTGAELAGVSIANGVPAPASADMLSSALRGHGTFIYDAIATISDYGSAENVAKAMVRAEMQHGWIRVHGRQPFSTPQKNATQELVAVLRAEGVFVAGWGWCQGEDPHAEAKSALKELARYSLTDYIADIEPGHNNSVWTVPEIEEFCDTVRDGLGGTFAISSFALIDWHEPHLMRAALPFVDAFAPQVYWFNFPSKAMVKQFKRPDGTNYNLNDPGSYADLCLDRWVKLSVTDPKPLIMTGQAYWGEGSFSQTDAEKKLQTFLDNWRGFERLAGLNWWHFGGGTGMSHAMLEAIVEAELGAKVPA